MQPILSFSLPVNLRRFMACLLLIISGSPLLAQSTRLSIHGRLLNRRNDHPIHYANVFLAGTIWGTTSLKNGDFTVENVPPGRYTLVIGMMGYKLVTKTVILKTVDAYLPAIKLKAKVIQTQGVTISAEEHLKWQKQLKRFTQAFIGYTPRAAQCRILNPLVLNFKEDRKTFTATASEALQIRNLALGFDIKLYLDQFEWKKNNNVLIQSYTHFTYRDTSDIEIMAAWQRAREEAYAGSQHHYLRSLAAGQVYSQGFECYTLTDHPARQRRHIIRQAIDADTLCFHIPGDNQAMIFQPRYMQIIYNKINEPDYMHRLRRRKGIRPSALVTHTSSDIIKHPTSLLISRASPQSLHKSGTLNNPSLMETSGFWGWMRIADMLPLNYLPDSLGAGYADIQWKAAADFKAPPCTVIPGQIQTTRLFSEEGTTLLMTFTLPPGNTPTPFDTFNLRTTFFDDNQSVIAQSQQTGTVQAMADTSHAMTAAAQLPLPRGARQCQITITNITDRCTFSQQIQLAPLDHRRHQLALSDLLVAHHIQPAPAFVTPTKKNYVHNDLFFRPIADNIAHTDAPLYVHVGIEGLLKTEGHRTAYLAEITVSPTRRLLNRLHARHQSITTHRSERLIHRKQSSDALCHAINLEGFHEGEYDIHISITDLGSSLQKSTKQTITIISEKTTKPLIATIEEERNE